MAQLPGTIRIGHLNYNVVRDQAALDAHSAEGNLPRFAGRSNAAKQLIIIGENLPADYEAETVLHEVLHSCLRVAGVDPDADAKAGLEDVEERAVNSIAGVLLAVLRDNPHLGDYLTGEINHA